MSSLPRSLNFLSAKAQADVRIFRCNDTDRMWAMTAKTCEI